MKPCPASGVDYGFVGVGVNIGVGVFTDGSVAAMLILEDTWILKIIKNTTVGIIKIEATSDGFGFFLKRNVKVSGAIIPTITQAKEASDKK